MCHTVKLFLAENGTFNLLFMLLPSQQNQFLHRKLLFGSVFRLNTLHTIMHTEL